MTPLHTILLIEGRKPKTEYLSLALEDEEYVIVTASTRRDSLAIVQEAPPTVIVLDSPSLRFSCQRFCSTLQDSSVDIPVLMLIPEGEKINHDIGARAYLHYPFTTNKLINRVNMLLPAPDDEVLRMGKLTLNIEQQYVARGNHESHLTPKQTRLLEVFMRHPKEVLSRAFLMKQVWKTDYVGDTQTLEVHVHWVRKAIEKDHGSPVYLHTVRGVGYRLDIPENEITEKKKGSKQTKDQKHN